MKAELSLPGQVEDPVGAASWRIETWFVDFKMRRSPPFGERTPV